MKKKLVMILMAVMVASATLGGCGQKGTSDAGSASAEAEDVQISAKELLKATDYKVQKYVKLNDYMNMTVEVSQDYTVDDDTIKSYIESLIAENPVYEASDKTTVESGDIVNIDYVGKVDGEEFTGGSAQGAHLTIGSGTFIDGFEDGLIGKNVGETVDLNLKFPDDYTNNTALAGKDVVFTVTINSIDTASAIEYDDLTDEYISENFGVANLDELKSQAKSSLESTAEYYKMQEVQPAVLAKLLEECEVTLPDGLLDQRIQEYKDRVNKAVEESGQSFEDYIGQSEDDYYADLDSRMEESVKEELILEAIVRDMDLSISESDFNSFVEQFMSRYSFTSKDDFYSEYGGEDYIKLSYAENQALSKVMQSVKTKVKETSSDSSDNADDSSATAE